MTARGRSPRPRARTEVLRILTGAGAVSRAELARQTGLAPSTVSAVVGELTAEGLVSEVPPSDAAGSLGRPATRVALHRSAGVAIGLDFGKRHVRVAVADLGHEILAEGVRAIEDDLPAAEAMALGVALVDAALGDAGAARADVVGTGMGVPGPMHVSGELGDSTILPGWVGVRAADVMAGVLGLPVVVGNDANLGALSEWCWGAGRGIPDLVYVKASTGVGAGFILDGAPFVGAGGTAGEIGHTVVDPHGAICRCGSRGCLETVAGVPAVLGALREVHGADLTVDEVVRRARAGDPGCLRALTDAGRVIGAALATMCNLVNPARIVVGGDLAIAGDLLLEPLRLSLGLAAIRSAAQDVEVVPSALGERAPALGAVALVLRRGAALVRQGSGADEGVASAS